MSLQIWDSERVVLIPDHYIFTSDPRANRNVDMLREYAKKYNIKYFYDIMDRSDFRANPDYKGVCHIALAQVTESSRACWSRLRCGPSVSYTLLWCTWSPLIVPYSTCSVCECATMLVCWQWCRASVRICASYKWCG